MKCMHVRTSPCRTMKVLFLSLKPSPRYCENSDTAAIIMHKLDLCPPPSSWYARACALQKRAWWGGSRLGSRIDDKRMAEAHLPSKEEARFSDLTNLRNRIFIMRHGQVSGPIGSVSYLFIGDRARRMPEA